MKALKLLQISFFGLLSSLVLASCSPKADIPAHTELVLGTVCTINLFENGTKELYDTLFKRLWELEDIFSANLPDSEISQINNSAGIASVKVSQEVIYLLSEAQKYAEMTDGAFDPTIGPLVKLWDIGGQNPHIPTQEEIDAVLPLVNYRMMTINQQDNTVYLEKAGMKLDVGGIAKGYAADEMVRILDSRRIRFALIDLGGNIYAYKNKPDGSDWRIGIKNPFNPQSGPIIRLDVSNKTVVTSGVYERFFEENGVRYHHILNPKTGYPVWNKLMSVTIISASSTQADALSTSAFILGLHDGQKLLSEIPDVNGIFITDTHDIYATTRTKDFMSVLAENFLLVN